ncbi:MAG: MBL fold metallo-hydrolase [Chloroflexota bacterium]
MEIHFLGGATTVTGSRFLLETSRAHVLVDCGMFQGGPNESVRNRIPLGFHPEQLDAILLTHAHLDHCGLLPVAIREGYDGPIYATRATAELARLVMLDSGRLQERFAKREARWEKRNPAKAIADDAREAQQFERALEQAVEGGAINGPSDHDAGHYETAVEPVDGHVIDPEADLRAQAAELEIDLDEPVYTERDANAVLSHFRPIEYGAEREVAPGIHATFLDAGHILGSAIIRLRVVDHDGDDERIVVFSGDLGRPGTPIISDPAEPTEADYVIVESTYGGREHDSHEEAIRVLAETVRLVHEVDGVLLIPSFAIGRTQEIVWELDRLIEKGEIPLLPLYLDSPMASRASDVYRKYTDYYDPETAALFRDGATPLDYPKQILTRSHEEAEAIVRAPRPYMIVASNGMLTGGRSILHLKNIVDDPTATILFVGFQGQGTAGAHLQSGAETVRIDGQVRRVRCRIRSISGFSAHADETELLAWLGNFGAGRSAGEPGFPRRVFLVHGDPDAQRALEPKVQALGFATHIPRWHERVELE